MKIKTEEIASVIKKEIESFSAQLEISEVGQVVEVGDGIARVYGLGKVMAGELLEFEAEGGGTVMGQAMNLETDIVGAALFGESTRVREGATVRSTGKLLEVPVGMEMLGRVVDPLGAPLDGGAPIKTAQTGKVDIVAPGIAHRPPVKEPMPVGRFEVAAELILKYAIRALDLLLFAQLDAVAGHLRPPPACCSCRRSEPWRRCQP